MKEEKKFFVPALYPESHDFSKYWFVYYNVPVKGSNRAKRIKVYGRLNRISSLEERLAHAEELMNEIAEKHPQPFPKGKPVSDLMAILEKYKPMYRPKTYLDHRTKIRKFEYWLEKKGLKADRITTKNANEFLLSLFSLGRKSGTVYSYRKALISLYSKWVNEETHKLKTNPFSGCMVIKRTPESLMYYNDSQIKILKEKLCSIDPQVWLVAQLGYYCFIRPGEVRGLKVADFNLDMGIIRIPASVSKNQKTEQVLIPQAFLPSLQFLRNFDPDFYIIGKEGVPGTKRWGKNRFNNQHREALKACDIRGKYALYSWKHTGVVKAVKAGINIVDLKNQLRHHSLDMVQEYLKNLGVLDSLEIRNNFPSLDAA